MICILGKEDKIGTFLQYLPYLPLLLGYINTIVRPAELRRNKWVDTYDLPTSFKHYKGAEGTVSNVPVHILIGSG